MIFKRTSHKLEILSFLAEGYSYKMIADKCNISYPTVNTHISHIYEKLHVLSGTEAVAKAIEFNPGGKNSFKMLSFKGDAGYQIPVILNEI